MKRRVLDTNRLIAIWHGRLPQPGDFGSPNSETEAVEAAMRWLKKFPNYGIITPVRLEFLGGVRNQDELLWSDAFLKQFQLLDEGRVLPEDWREAERLARRVKHTGRTRDAMDCVIKAICNRLHIDINTEDTGMPG